MPAGAQRTRAERRAQGQPDPCAFDARAPPSQLPLPKGDIST